MGPEIPSSALAALRGILVSSLSRENLPFDDSAPSAPPRRHRARKVTFLEAVAGATPADSSQRPAPGRPSAQKDSVLLASSTGGDATSEAQPWFDSATDPGKENGGASQKEREERIRALRERQGEERQRKLEELKQQALAAQKFREQKEEERRRRIEELRLRDSERRYQVEERKRLIWEAEHNRREAIMRKNMEREARIDTKRKNERSSIVFAFGSSTPRMLEPADTGGSFWGTRKATSTTNVMMFTAAPLTRRSSERELDGGKKRATSASGLDRKPVEGEDHELVDAATPTLSAASVTRVNRRKTDLMPTIPSPRDGSGGGGSRPASARASLGRSPGLRSGEVTPTHPSRPQSALSQQSMTSVNSGVSLRARPTATPRRQRPFSIAVTGVSADARSPKAAADKESSKPPLPKVHAPKKPPAPQPKPEAPARKNIDRVMKGAKASPKATPKATPLTSPGTETPPSALVQEVEGETEQLPKEEPRQEEVKRPAEEVRSEAVVGEPAPAPGPPAPPAAEEPGTTAPEEPKAPVVSADAPLQQPAVAAPEQPEPAEASKPADASEQESEMTASMIAKIRITTEEEAKAALAERRRLAREQAEREAELEKQRLEEERRQEEARLRQEEEEQRRFEEEQLRLVEEARRAEEERLLQAIQENERREEEERKRREEEARAKAEREEMEKKAREESERQRREMDEKLKREEEERVARRKRVEAIMVRTRQSKGGTPTGTPTKGQNDGDSEGENGKERSELQEAKGSDEKPEEGGDNDHSGPSNGQVDGLAHAGFDASLGQARVASAGSSSEMFIDSEVKHAMETSEDLVTSATSVTSPPLQEQQRSNGHRNGALDFVNVDNVTQNNTTNNLLDLSGFDSFGATNNVLNASSQQLMGDFMFDPLNPSVGKIANEDNVNSNVINNGTSATLITFDDNLSKKQDANSVTDLLS